MPISIADKSIDAAAASGLDVNKETFLIFYSSRDERGKLWCPDCIAVDGIVQEAFGPEEGPSAILFYVGNNAAEWKAPSNPFRGEPWHVKSIPTIIKVRDGHEVERLVENEINDSDRLASFVRIT